MLQCAPTFADTPVLKMRCENVIWGEKWVCNRSEPCHTGEIHSHKVQSYPLPIQTLKSYYSPSPSPDSPRPINTSQSPVTDGCRGQQGLGGVERGFAKVRLGHGVFEIVVTWPVFLSMCRWMSSMWAATPSSHPILSQSQGFDCRSESQDGGIPWSSQTNPPRICAFGLLSTPLHLLWKRAALSHGGSGPPKKTEGTHGPGQYGTMVILWFSFEFSSTLVFLWMTFVNDQYL